MQQEDIARGEGGTFHLSESIRGNRVAALVVKCNANRHLVCLCVILWIMALWKRSELKEEMMNEW